MRHGKDVLMDKPGVTTEADLALLQQTVAQTRRIFSICCLRAVPGAGDHGRAAPSSVTAPSAGSCKPPASAHTASTARSAPTGSSSRRDMAASWPTSRLTQIDQFLVFTGSDDARIVTSTIGIVDDPRLDRPAHDLFENFGEIVLRSERAAGYCRVDWFTPDGLPTWGDGRLTVIGTEGSIELRKYLDIEGRPGTDHLFLADRTGTRYIDCAAEPITYFSAFCADVLNRTETTMAQSHVWTVCRLALAAQSGAERVTLAGGVPR